MKKRAPKETGENALPADVRPVHAAPSAALATRCSASI